MQVRLSKCRYGAVVSTTPSPALRRIIGSQNFSQLSRRGPMKVR